MYTFQPITDYSDTHSGFFVLAAICLAVFFIVIALWKNDEIEFYSVVIWTCILGALAYAGQVNSYTPHHPLNEQHIGTLVGFDAEGYRERSGKQMVDRHYTYVVYNIDGNEVMFEASTGFAYPKRIVVYKN